MATNNGLGYRSGFLQMLTGGAPDQLIWRDGDGHGSPTGEIAGWCITPPEVGVELCGARTSRILRAIEAAEARRNGRVSAGGSRAER